jgi:hypothetical protein
MRKTRRKGKLRVFGGDLETDNDGDKAWIVQWAISDGTDEITGTSIESLRDRLKVMMRSFPSVIYFHNLKYDLSFIKYALFDIMVKDGIMLFPIMRNGNPIMVSLQPPEDSGMHELSFRDSMKKLQGNLAAVAKSVGMSKLEGFEFYPGWSNAIDFNDVKNWDYVKMDARIVAVAMQHLHADGNTKPTFSGDAWRNAQRMLNGSDMRTDNDNWNKYFPKLDADVDKALRSGYSGGLNISRHKGLNVGQITHADVNSMYPTVMYYDELPHGEPIYSRDEPKSSVFVVKAKFKLKLKPGLIPWFTFKHGGEYVLEDLSIGTPIVETKFFHTLTLTSVDVALMSAWYDVEIDASEAEYWSFKSNVGIFREYIDKYMEMKKKEAAEGRKGKLGYNWAKLMMNSLYGRFGLNADGEETTLEFDTEINDIKWKPVPAVIDIDGYLPYAMFITAHARRRLLDYVMRCGSENVIHCDTDSVIHYGGRVPGIEYGHDLGQWDVESEPFKIWEGGFKRYIEQITPEIDSVKSLKMAAAGVSNRRTDSGVPVGMWIELWDNPEIICSNQTLGNLDYKIKSEWLRKVYAENGLNPDKVNTMKLIPVTVPGGAILVERKHKLDDCMKIGFRKR